MLATLLMLPRGRVLVRSCEQSLSVADVLDRTEKWRAGVGEVCALQSVVVSCESAVAMICCVAALDGWASKIVLAPPSLGPTGLQDFAAAAGASLLVADYGVEIFGVTSLGIPEFSGGPVASSSFQKPQIETEWLLATSGTTGKPKLFTHTFASLSYAARRPSEKSPDFVWGLVYDPHRFAGLQVIVQCLVAGSPVAVPPSRAELPEIVRVFARLGVNSLSATPSFWRRLLMTPGFETLPLKQITLGGEIADQSLLDALGECFAAARIVHIYACTEAGVGFSVKDRRVGFPRSYLEQAPGGAVLKIDMDGVLHIKPPGRIPRQVAVSPSNSDGDPFVRTDDKVEISGDRVVFLGRASGLINVGGLKVLPEEVEVVLLSHPGVAHACVRGKRNSISGQLVEADVELRAGVAANGMVAELRAFCSQRLPPYKVPALIRIVSILGPLTAAGKQERVRSL